MVASMMVWQVSCPVCDAEWIEKQKERPVGVCGRCGNLPGYWARELEVDE